MFCRCRFRPRPRPVVEYWVFPTDSETMIDDGSRGSSEIKRIVCFDFFLKVVTQPYEAEADNEYVIRGNTAIMKCEVPSFVADFVTVEMWMDTDGNTYYQNSDYGNNTS